MNVTIEKSYIVWYWSCREQKYRIGETFKDKGKAEKFADDLKHWQYIGIVASYKIIVAD